MKSKTFFKSLIITLFITWSFAFTQGALANNTYSVKGVEASDVLNLRKFPGSKSLILAQIPPNGSAIRITNKAVKKGRSTWIQVKWKGKKGWVNNRYLTPVGRSASSNSGARKHTHPKNECTNSIKHTHPNGNKSHVHSYSCKKKAGKTATSNANGHTHPKNKCTRSITHSHPNGKRTHAHRYSCKNNRAKVNVNVNAHMHPKNKCTRSITHSHPNGKRTHAHHYSCKSKKTRQDPNAHTHPRKKCTRSITHTHPNGKRTHAHRYSCK